MNRLVRYVGILFVARTFIVFTPVTLPVAKTHPTEIEFAIEAF